MAWWTRIAGMGFAASAAVIAACSSSGGTSSVSAMQACTDASNAVCARLDACSDFFVQLSYGGVAACASTFAAQCNAWLASKGTSWTPALMEGCAQALPGAACADITSNNFPMACRAPAGTLAAGAGCGDDSQCASQYCNKGTNGICGACGTRVGPGASCQRDDDCGFGNGCVSGMCVAWGGMGATCDAMHPCSSAFACKSGTCAAPDEAGASCSLVQGSLFGTCDVLAGTFCNLSKTCEKIGVSTAGNACTVDQNAVTVCAANGQCDKLTNGTCKGAGGAGASCGGQNPGCQPGFACSGGVCKAEDPSTCM